MFHVPNQYRLKNNSNHHAAKVLGSDNSYGNNGCFIIPHPKIDHYLINVQVSDGKGWDHVSVSLSSKKMKVERCPTWEEMCFIKDMFWDKDDCVIQYHPAESEYISMHKYCLHLWRPQNVEIPIPDKIMVGINL